MTLVHPDKYFSCNDHSFLDVACSVSPIDHLLLGGHVGLDFVGETIRGVENLPAHEFVVPFDPPPRVTPKLLARAAKLLELDLERDNSGLSVTVHL